MNKKNAKKLTFKEVEKMLPKWYIEMLKTTLSIVKHSYFSSFRQLKNFLEISLQDIQKKDDNSDLKYVKVICSSKGEKENLVYIPLDLFIKIDIKNKDLWLYCLKIYKLDNL